MNETVVVGLSREVIEKDKLARLYAEGGTRAMGLVVDAIKHRRPFNPEFVRTINSKILFYAHEDVRGRLRGEGDNSTEVDSELVARGGRELELKFYKFCRWIESGLEDIDHNSEDLVGALILASQAHYGLTGPQLHPFIDGNGRTARVLTNYILMRGAKEAVDHKIPLPPVPIMRQKSNGKNRLKTHKGVYIDPYIDSLRQVRHTRAINPLARYIADRWSHNLVEVIDLLNQHLQHPTKSDYDLITQFERRKMMLNGFIANEDRGLNPKYPIVDPASLDSLLS